MGDVTQEASVRLHLCEQLNDLVFLLRFCVNWDAVTEGYKSSLKEKKCVLMNRAGNVESFMVALLATLVHNRNCTDKMIIRAMCFVMHAAQM